MTAMSADIFGRVHLGYLVIETEKFSDWRRFGRDAIGMHLDETLPGLMRFRLDDHAGRVLVQRGPDGRRSGGSATTCGSMEAWYRRSIRSSGTSAPSWTR